MQMASSLVHASSAPVQFTIPDTTLTIKGFSSPGAFVQIIDGSSLIGTVIADKNGVFEKDFPAMRAGLHNIKISYDDVDKLASDPLSQTINIRAQSDTAVEYFLPPTLSVKPVSLVEGDIVTISGSSIPNSVVEVLLDGGTTILRPQTDARGRYSISIDTTGYYLGEHSLKATSSQGGLTSFQTLTRPFIVLPIESRAGRDNQPPQLIPPSIDIGGEAGEVTIDQESALLRGNAAPNSQIIIYLDGEPVGSTFANADGNWFFNIKVTANLHEVRAVSCSGDECSDFSNLIKLIYKGEIGRCSSHRFWLSEYRFWDIKERSGIDLNISGISATPPYEIVIDWGDTYVERFNRNTAQSFNVNHTYDVMGSYNGRIAIIDEDGCEYERLFTVGVIESRTDKLWLGFGAALLVGASLLLLRRRYRIHRKKLSLAR